MSAAVPGCVLQVERKRQREMKRVETSLSSALGLSQQFSHYKHKPSGIAHLLRKVSSTYRTFKGFRLNRKHSMYVQWHIPVGVKHPGICNTCHLAHLGLDFPHRILGHGPT